MTIRATASPGWGRSSSTRISWRRLPDRDQGLLYGFDTVWDAYAVLANPVHRDVVREAYAHALTTHPDMDPERFAALIHALPHQPAAPAPPAAPTTPATSPALGVGR